MYGPTDADIAAVFIYEPEYTLDCIQEFYAETAFSSLFSNAFHYSIYEAVCYTPLGLADLILGSTYWTKIVGVDRTNWYEFTGAFIWLTATGTWATSYRPTYMLLVFFASGNTDCELVGSSETIWSDTLAPGGHIIKLDWTDITEDILHLRLTAPDSTGGLYSLVFSDDIETLLQIQQYFRIQVDSEEDLVYAGVGPFVDFWNPDFTTTDINHVLVGCGFPQELETLMPYMPTQLGSGRSTIRGNNRVHVGLLNSSVPYINGVLSKADANAEVDDEVIISGYARSTIPGYSRSMTTRITKFEPERLEINEIVLDITQSEDG